MINPFACAVFHLKPKADLLRAAHRLGRDQVAPAVEAVAGQDPPDVGFGNSGLGGGALIDTAFPAQGDHLGFDIVMGFVRAAIRLG